MCCRLQNENDIYESYKKARNKAWDVLYECGINRLPIDLWSISHILKLSIVPYSQTSIVQIFTDNAKQGDGFVTIINGNKTIFINDKIKYLQRRRFTVAHEIGHAVLEHDIGEIHYRNSEIDNLDDQQELEANVFARDLLMPAFVLKELNVRSADEIMRICNVSRQSAEIRLKRLTELYQRGKFYTSDKESRLVAQFEEFIYTQRKSLS